MSEASSAPLAVFGPPLPVTDPFAVPQGGLHIFTFVLFTHADMLLTEPWGPRLGVPNTCLHYAEGPVVASQRVAHQLQIDVSYWRLLDVISSEERRLQHWNIVFVYWATMTHIPVHLRDHCVSLESLPETMSSFLRDDIKLDMHIQHIREQNIHNPSS